MSAEADPVPVSGSAAEPTVWARLRAAGRWLLQRDVHGGSPWDERWSSCGPLPVDESRARHTQPTDGPPPRR